MSKVAWNRAQAADKRIGKIQWSELVKILESNYDIKALNRSDVFLRVPGEDKADIEIYYAGPPAVDPFHVQLWYFDLSSNDTDFQKGTCTSVSDVILRVDNILRAVKAKKKYG